MTLGEKLQKLRKGKAMSQEELASKITVSRQAISKWELDLAFPDTENIVQLSKLYNVSADYLLNDDYDSDMDIPVVKAYEKIMRRSFKIQTLSIVLIAIGSISTILSILSTSFMQIKDTEMYGHAYKSEMDYLSIAPLKYIMIIAVIMIIAGVGIIVSENINANK